MLWLLKKLTTVFHSIRFFLSQIYSILNQSTLRQQDIALCHFSVFPWHMPKATVNMLFMHFLNLFLMGNFIKQAWLYVTGMWFLGALTLCKKCSYSELFWSAFSRRDSAGNAVLMRENADQNNSEYRHFSRSVEFTSWVSWNSFIFSSENWIIATD